MPLPPPVAYAAAETLSAETSRALAEIEQDIETLRVSMGRSRVPAPKVSFRNVSYYELHQLSHALRERANDLHFEWSRESMPTPDVDHRLPDESTLRENLDATLHLLGAVANTIGQTLPAPPNGEHPLDKDQALATLFLLNRQLNNIMNEKVGPGDVFAKVSLGVKYASDLLANFPTARRIPPDEPMPQGKRPADVYERLAGCLVLSGKVVDTLGGKPVEMVQSDFTGIEITPSDVYDLAALNIGQLDRLSHQTKGNVRDYLLSYVGPRTPSHVFQRVGLIETQLTLLGDMRIGRLRVLQMADDE